MVSRESPAAETAFDEATPQPASSLRRNWNFQALWTSEALAGIAKESAEIAYPLLILAKTGSAFDAGAVGSAQLFTISFMSIPGGMLADKIGRRFLLMASDMIRAVLLGVLALLIFGHHFDLPLIFAISIGSAICLGIAQPASLAAVNQVVRPD
jgi:MFS family permease